MKTIGEIVGGGTPSTSVKEYWNNGNIIWVTPAYMSKLNSNYVNTSDRKITNLGLNKSSAKLMPAGSVIMSSRAPIGYLAINTVPACTSQGCKSLVPYNLKMSAYLLYVIKASVNRIIEASKGTTFDEISGTKFGNILIPIAPVNEEIRICQLIENISRIIINISSQYTSIKKYVLVAKQKVLDSIFGPDSSYKSYYDNMGFITDDIEVLDHLRIPVNSEERAKRIEKAKILYPYYGATGQTGYIDDFLVDGEFVLLGEDGAPFLDKASQKAYIINGKAWINNHVHLLKSKTNNRFLMHYLNWFDYFNYVSGTTRLKLNQGMLKKIPFPILSSNIKEEIVKHIDDCFNILDGIN